LIIGLCTSCKSERGKKEKIEESFKTFYIKIPSDYQLNDSSIIGIESMKENCTENDKQCFDCEDVDTLNRMNYKIVLIKSWEELQGIRQQLKSKALQNIKKPDFSRFDYAVTLITHGGSYLRNEKLIKKDDEAFFSYELWSINPKPSPVPASIDLKLYILQLRKGSLTKVSTPTRNNAGLVFAMAVSRAGDTSR
jgi:hypothetical protein